MPSKVFSPIIVEYIQYIKHKHHYSMSRGIVNGNKKAYDDTFPINALTTKKLIEQIELFLLTWHRWLQ